MAERFSSKADFMEWAMRVGTHQALDELWKSRRIKVQQACSSKDIVTSPVMAENDLRIALDAKVQELRAEIVARDRCIEAMLSLAKEFLGSSPDTNASFHSKLAHCVQNHNDLHAGGQENANEIERLNTELKESKKEIKSLRKLGRALHAQLRLTAAGLTTDVTGTDGTVSHT